MNEQKLPFMINRGLLDGKKSIRDFKLSQYMDCYLSASGALDTGILYRSHIHGLGHIERVMLLGALIAKAEKLSLHETNLLLFACSYHDIGRANDSKDDLHSRRSAMMIAEKGLWERFGEDSEDELRAIQAAICTHSVNDAMFDELAEEFGVKEELMPLCKTVCFCLKDADNLDRVRLYDLDTKHLRHESSLNLVKTAQYLFEEYSKN